ncbi:glutathione peroxidase [Thalassobacillus pellis]|uniref:glutathione peroxidase n=1 Tax=Thalassobacillus pellis TaxID=748008 RepID=UPI00195F7440|nr:glutathione peroxidase [Thalassobacillus pellis]MBM7554179.1 glutathione peroxidase [Thalassobacillus pellis]
MSVHDFSAKTITGEEKPLSEYSGKVLLIVNTASKCGFTPQYEGLQELYDKYHENGFEVLGFPSNQFMNQEPGSDEEIQEFCKLNYGVSFPMFSKTDVRGKEAHPLFQYLIKQAPGVVSDQVKWNFTKFLVDQDGQVFERYAPKTNPESIEKDIEKLLR